MLSSVVRPKGLFSGLLIIDMTHVLAGTVWDEHFVAGFDRAHARIASLINEQ